MNRDTSRPDKLARQMFFVGLLGLPWLWIVNILYFFDRVYGRIPCFGSTGAASSEHNVNNNSENNTAILGLITNESEGNDDGGFYFCIVIFLNFTLIYV